MDIRLVETESIELHISTQPKMVQVLLGLENQHQQLYLQELMDMFTMKEIVYSLGVTHTLIQVLKNHLWHNQTKNF